MLEWSCSFSAKEAEINIVHLTVEEIWTQKKKMATINSSIFNFRSK